MIGNNKSAKRQAGQGLVEYVLIITLVALAVIMVLVLFGPALGRTFRSVQQSIGLQGGPPAAETQVAAGTAGTAVATATGNTLFGTPIVTDTPAPTETPTPAGTSTLTATVAVTGTSAAGPTETPAASATSAPSDTMEPTSTTAPSSTMEPSSTTRPGTATSTPAPTNTPVPTNTAVPTHTPVPTNVPAPTSVPTNSPVPQTNTPVPTNAPARTNTPLPPPTATPLTGVILAASTTRTGGESGNALDVTVSVSRATTLTLIDSAAGTLAAGQACSGTCVVHIGSIGKNAGYIAITAAAGGVLTVWYPAKS